MTYMAASLEHDEVSETNVLRDAINGNLLFMKLHNLELFEGRVRDVKMFRKAQQN